MLRRIQALHNFKSKHARRLGDHTAPEKVEFEAMRMVEGHGGWGEGSTPVSKTDLHPDGPSVRIYQVRGSMG